jgi:signal transduction histidine kinase
MADSGLLRAAADAQLPGGASLSFDTTAAGRGSSQTVWSPSPHDLQLLESSVEDMVTFTRPVPTERLPERLAVLVAEALELKRESVRKAKLDPKLGSVQQDVPESIVVPQARHQIEIALANVLKNAYEAFQFKDTMRSGAIRIAASTCHKWVTLAIEDTGQAICEEELRTPLLLTLGRRKKSKRHSTGYVQRARRFRRGLFRLHEDGIHFGSPRILCYHGVDC